MQTTWPESFLILFIETRINQGTERILSHCRKDPEIYWGNRPVEPIDWLICDKIPDLLSIDQVEPL